MKPERLLESRDRLEAYLPSEGVRQERNARLNLTVTHMVIAKMR